MKKTYILALILVVTFLIPQFCLSSSSVYDEENGIIYLGGFPIEMLRYEIDKIEEVYLKDKIYILNIKKGTSKLLLNSDNRIFAYEISSKGYIAVATTTKDEERKEYKNELILYKNNGEKIRIIEDNPVWNTARHFLWNRDGDKIAYISGKVIIEGHNPFEPTGVWIYDIKNDKTIKIADKGVDINWSKHDSNIYIQNEFRDPTNISVYNTSTGQLSKSDKRGMKFTDDGKYYIGLEEVKGYDYPTFVPYVFYNINNKKKIFSSEEESRWRHEMMLQYKFINNTHYLLVWERDSYKVLDIEKVKVMTRGIKKGIVGWNKDMTKIVVYEGGNQIHIDELLTGERLKSINIPRKE